MKRYRIKDLADISIGELNSRVPAFKNDIIYNAGKDVSVERQPGRITRINASFLNEGKGWQVGEDTFRHFFMEYEPLHFSEDLFEL